MRIAHVRGKQVVKKTCNFEKKVNEFKNLFIAEHNRQMSLTRKQSHLNN